MKALKTGIAVVGIVAMICGYIGTMIAHSEPEDQIVNGYEIVEVDGEQYLKINDLASSRLIKVAENE